MNPYAIVLGAIIAVAVVLLFKFWRLEESRWAYPLLLAEFPVNYWGFAVYGSDSAALREELIIGLAFLAIAFIAYRFKSFATLLMLACGYVMHAAYDFAHDTFFVNAGTPGWWPEFCASVDVLIGGYLVYLALASRRAMGLARSMPQPTPANNPVRRLPRRVAVLGAAGGLGQGIIAVCKAEGIPFTAIVRSRPERITEVPDGSRVAVVTSLADRAALAEAFAGADVVLTALGVTSTSADRSALLSANMATVEQALLAAGVDRMVVVNTLLSSLPGRPASRAMRFFSSLPGTIGRGAREQQAVVDALGRGAFSSLRWTLVRGGLNSRGRHEAPVAAADWGDAVNSWAPVSYEAMGRWMLEEAATNAFVRAAPLVSRRRR